MWSDNETADDLVGFEYLVDQLELVLIEPHLRPVTVGVTGGWGSGKTSLMQMAAERLSREGYVCAWFSPWRFEDYDDVKHALTATVIGALEAELGRKKKLTDQARALVEGVRRRAHRMRLARAAGGATALLATGDPTIAAAAAEVADAAIVPSDADAPGTFESTASFRSEFQRLLEELEDDVGPLLVFIDDLDRCLPPAVLDTLEALRLFLNVPRTGFVIAADPQAIRRSIEENYPVERTTEGELGTDYLEKILQFTVAIPPLSVPEVETYANLLFAELHLDEVGVQTLREAARARRRDDQLAAAMNLGIAGEALNEVPSDLADDFGLVAQIATPLAEGLRGNPREIKRFLNTLLLRLGTAKRSDVALEPGILAKLMILEERHTSRFQRLFDWQLAGDGAPPELAAAEAVARGQEAEGEVGAEAREWAEDGPLVDWLRLEPALAGVDLGPYFSYARDNLGETAPASRLSGREQAILHRLLDDRDTVRRGATAELGGNAFQPSEREQVFAVLIDRVAERPTAEGLRTAGELAVNDETLVPILIAALERIPPKAIPRATPPQYRRLFKDDSRFAGIFETWEEKGPASARASRKR